MKNFRSVTSSVIFTVIMLVSGCSEKIIAPETSESAIQREASREEKNVNQVVIHNQVNLKPNQVYTFDTQNSIYSAFNSISVLNCPVTKNNVEILGHVNDMIAILGCNSKGFLVHRITIENKNSHSVELDVYLTAVLKKYTDPVSKNYDIY